MSSSSSKLYDELNRLQDELKSVDEDIRQLKIRRRELEQKISTVENRITARAKSVNDDTTTWESDSFPWSKAVTESLHNFFKLKEFRPLQRSAINVIMSGEDCLLIMSTGGGKSLTYQLPAIVKKGVTLVISPLVSLIEDQIIQLNKLGIRAATLNQHSTKEEVKMVHDALGDTNTELRLLYVTPEKLAKSKRIMNRLEKCAEIGSLKLMAVDEVHCCSQWGHDFRPDYQFLNMLKRQFKGVPLLGLTATATATVLDDVKEILGIKGAITLRATFNRENLFYEVRPKPSTSKEMVNELVSVIKKEFHNETGIIYCFSRKECEEVTTQLKSRGIASAYYHAYLERDSRRKVHEQWLVGRYKVIVATLAFGMGIDKSDVRFVIHHSLAKSMENYYQESGRAGRDGKPAKCILYYRLTDLFRQSTMVCSEKTGLQNLYSMLAYTIRGAECRRVSIAEHFDENWDASWCQQMCDKCKSREKLGTQTDVAVVFAEIIRSIQAQADSDQNRITGNKLLDILGKSAAGQAYGRDALEEIIARLLLEGYLREDFHFTPYNIISYVQLAARAKNFTPECKVIVELVSTNVQPASEKRKLKSEAKSTQKRQKMEKDKPEIVLLE